jgi:ferredoxin
LEGGEGPIENQYFQVTLITPEGERIIRVNAAEHIWDAAAAQGLRLPALCHQGWCLTCAAHVEQGQVDQTDSAGFYPEDRAAGFALLCTGKARSNLTVRTHQSRAMREHRLRLRLPAPYSAGVNF